MTKTPQCINYPWPCTDVIQRGFTRSCSVRMTAVKAGTCWLSSASALAMDESVCMELIKLSS